MHIRNDHALLGNYPVQQTISLFHNRHRSISWLFNSNPLLCNRIQIRSFKTRSCQDVCFLVADSERWTKLWQESQQKIRGSRNFATNHQATEFQWNICRFPNTCMWVGFTPWINKLTFSLDHLQHHHKEWREANCYLPSTVSSHQQHRCIPRKPQRISFLKTAPTLFINVLSGVPIVQWQQSRLASITFRKHECHHRASICP